MYTNYVNRRGDLSKSGFTKHDGQRRARQYAGGYFAFGENVCKSSTESRARAIEKATHRRIKSYQDKGWLKNGYTEVHRLPWLVVVDIMKQEAGMIPYRAIDYNDLQGEMAEHDLWFKEPLIHSKYIPKWIDKLKVGTIGAVLGVLPVVSTLWWYGPNSFTWNDGISIGSIAADMLFMVMGVGPIFFAMCLLGLGFAFGITLGIHNLISLCIGRPLIIGRTI